jgi:hypothetical protein
MMNQDLKKKRRGLLPLDEKMGLDQTTEYNTPGASKPGIVSDSDINNMGGETAGDKVRNRMTGR